MHYDAALQRKLNELAKRIERLQTNVEEKPEYGLGKGDPLVTRWEFNQAMLSRLKRRTVSVRDALSRFHDSTYGIRERYGGAIQPDRLAALPATSLCIRCAREVGPHQSKSRLRLALGLLGWRAKSFGMRRRQQNGTAIDKRETRETYS